MEASVAFTLGLITIPLIAGVVCMIKTRKDIKNINNKLEGLGNDCNKDNRDINHSISNLREELISRQDADYAYVLKAIEEIKNQNLENVKVGKEDLSNLLTELKGMTNSAE